MTGATQIVYFNQNGTFTNNNWALYVGFPFDYASPVPNASLTDVSVSPTGEIYTSGYLSILNGASYYRTHVVLSITSLGVISWNSEYSTGTTTNTWAQSIILDSSSIYVAGNGSRSNYATVMASKYNTSGARQWITKVSQPQPPNSDQGATQPYAIAVNSSLGKIYIAGVSNLFGVLKGQLYTYDTSGNLIDQAYYGAGGISTYATSLVIDSSNNLWTSGYHSGTGGTKAAIAKFDSDLNSLGFKTFSANTVSPAFFTKGINKDSSGYIYLTGQGANFSGGLASMYIAKYDSSMNLVSSQKYTDSANTYSYDDAGVSTIDSSNNIWISGRILGGGSTSSIMHVLKVDPSTLSILMSRQLTFQAYDYLSNALTISAYTTSIKVQGTNYYLVLQVQVSGGVGLPAQTFGLLLKLPTDGSLTSATPRTMPIGYPASLLSITYLSVSPTSSSITTSETTPVTSAINYGFPTYTSSEVSSTTIPYNVNKPFV